MKSFNPRSRCLSGKRRTHRALAKAKADSDMLRFFVRKTNIHSELFNRDKPIAHHMADIHPSKCPARQRLRTLRNAVEREAECAFQ